MTLGEFFTALGYVVGGLVFWLAARQRKLATEGVAQIVAAGLLFGAIGAKVSQLLAQGWPVRIPWFVVLEPQVGGRALLGGLIFGWVGVEIAKRRMGIKRSTGDLFALALPAGEAVGRIGCFYNGCCYGIACDLPWAVEQHGALRHPAQLYSAASSAVLLGLLLWVRPKLTREGDLFRMYLIGFAVFRFGLEFLRWRESLIWGLSPMQWFCFDLIFMASFQWWKLRRREAAA